MSIAKSGSGGTGFVSDNSVDDTLYPIYGVAIGSNDITVGHKTGKRKLWTPEVLEESASTLAGKEVVVDHENRSSRKVIGEIQDAKFKESVGVIYKGVIDDDELATKIDQNWLEVSPRIIHSKEMEERDGLYVPKSIRKFDNLSIVVRGASESNSINLGEAEELMSVEELQSEFNSDDSVVEEYQDFEGQVNMRKYLFPTEEGALGAAQALGCSGSHEIEFEGETMHMPCDSRDQFLKSLSQTEEMQTDKEWRQGDLVKWSSSGGMAHGRVTDWTDSGTFDSEIDGDVSVSGTEEDPAALINVYQEISEGWEEGDTTVGHKFSTLNEWNPNNLVDENERCYTCGSVEELVISEAREPEYDSTEEKSWGDIPAATLSYYTENLDYDAERWDDLTEEQKQEVVSHTLLGDPDADTADNGIFFPVVNAETGDLNRGALEAVRSGRGQSADIPEDTYESAFRIAGRLLNEEFGSDVEVEMTAQSLYESVIIEELQEDLDEVYSEWSDTVNMTASELRRWSGNPCSREASVDPEAVIERNLNLLETNKEDWGEDEIEDANRTISFINRMRPNEPDGDASDGANGCPTDWAISLLNWAYNPFDDLPEQPDDEDLESVEELETLGIEEGDMVQWRVLPAMGKVVAIDDERSVAMVSVFKNGKDTDIAVTAGFEDLVPMETEEMSKHSEEMSGHSKEEMQTASQMASQTKMTKKEALKFLSGLNPTKGTDARGMGEMLAKAMKADEMEKMMDEMSKHMDSEMGSGSGGSKKDSPLNRIS
jgi:hypothetical protein